MNWVFAGRLGGEFLMMKRREFMKLLGGAAATWPLAARAQVRDRLRTIGVIMNYAEIDPEGQARLSALREGLNKLGWAAGSNIRIEYRWAAGKTDRMQAYATEVVGLPADIIVVNSTPLVAVLRQVTRTIPIVFVQVADPVGSGFVSSYARPGGNITGFTDFETSIVGKWIELLKEAAPFVNRVAVLLDPKQGNHHAFWEVIESAAPSFQVQVSSAGVRNRVEIEHAIQNFAGQARCRHLTTCPWRPPPSILQNLVFGTHSLSL
jgi:putative ABC transport system substrate-binding protein